MANSVWKYVDVNASPEEIEEAVEMVSAGTANIKFTENGNEVAVMIALDAYENIKKQITQFKRSI